MTTYIFNISNQNIFLSIYSVYYKNQTAPWCGIVVGRSHRTDTEVKHRPTSLVPGWMTIRGFITHYHSHQFYKPYRSTLPFHPNS